MTTQLRYIYMLLGMLVVLVAAPVASYYERELLRLTLNVGIVMMLLIGIWAMAPSRSWQRAGWALVVVAATAAALDAALPSSPAKLVLLATLFVFCLLSGWIALRDVLFGGPIDENRLAGAICVYLLIGFAWSVLYLYLALFDAASFRGLGFENWEAGSAELLYFSFVTLTTLGYGDLAPVTPLARTLAYLEAVFGQMYLTVLVAALVGKLLARREL